MLVTLLTIVLEDEIECNIAEFADSPSEIPVGLSYQITEKGFMTFLDNSLDLLLPQLYSYDIPSQFIDLDVMTFSMTDIHVNDVSKPKVKVSY